MRSSVSAFYEEHADLYALISRDRDFDAQLDYMTKGLSFGSEGPHILELCAGPGYHALAALRRGWGNVHCVDASDRFKSVAVASGVPEDRYHVRTLPAELPKPISHERFDVVCLLRFSLGYFSFDEASLLSSYITRSIRPGGRLFLELHYLPFLMSGFDDLEIKERRVLLSEEETTFECVWPSGPCIWEEEDLIVQMPLVIRWIKDEMSVRTHNLVSRERIYTTSEVKRAFEQQMEFACISSIHNTAPFNGATLVCFERL